MEAGILPAAATSPAVEQGPRSSPPLIFALAAHSAPDRREPGSAPCCLLWRGGACYDDQEGRGQSSGRATRAPAPRDGVRTGVRTHGGRRQDKPVLAAAGRCEGATQR